MDYLPHLIGFIAGVVVGVALIPLSSLLHWKGIDTFFHLFGQMITFPFRLLGRIMRTGGQGVPTVPEGGLPSEEEENDEEPADQREQLISDVAQVIRGILHALATAIHRADQAATDSTQILGEVRRAIEEMRLPDDLSDVNTHLLREIDRLVTSNLSLRRELADSQTVLETQRRQIETLKVAVRVDGLTRLANRAAFDEKLVEQMAIFKRYDEPFSLLMIDVDRFKEINDTHGHQGGDRILKGIAYKIKGLLRESDFVARYGGDEFAVILTRTTGTIACDVAWKLCNEIRGSRFILDGLTVKTTLSIGAAQVEAGETAENLLRRADRALYKVKEIGRNGVVLADQSKQDEP
ncbi:MAG: hypothetical protein Fur0034_20410 [Desulfuromonadia bacterium]